MVVCWAALCGVCRVGLLRCAALCCSVMLCAVLGCGALWCVVSCVAVLCCAVLGGCCVCGLLLRCRLSVSVVVGPASQCLLKLPGEPHVTVNNVIWFMRFSVPGPLGQGQTVGLNSALTGHLTPVCPNPNPGQYCVRPTSPSNPVHPLSRPNGLGVSTHFPPSSGLGYPPCPDSERG